MESGYICYIKRKIQFHEIRIKFNQICYSYLNDKLFNDKYSRLTLIMSYSENVLINFWYLVNSQDFYKYHLNREKLTRLSDILRK